MEEKPLADLVNEYWQTAKRRQTVRKKQELTNPESCMNRAKHDEMMFVLLGRDPAAPTAIRAWITARIMLGKNKPDDAQIVEAESCASTMEREQELTDAQVDFLLERFDQTDPKIQRRIVAHLMLKTACHL